MAGNITLKYAAASSALTVTNLHSLGAQQTWLNGWSSASVNNTSNLYLDWMYGGTFTTHASNRQVGSINVWVLAALNDTPTWPATASGTPGTEGALSFTAAEMRDSLCRLLCSITTTATASQIYTFPPTGIAQLFGGSLPTHHCLYIAHNVSTTTTAGLAAAGSALYATPILNAYT